MRMLISIFGPDGSGKSTQARLLAAYLASKGLKVKVVWIRSFHTLAYILSRLYRRLSPSSVELNAYGHVIRIRPLCRGRLRRLTWAWIELISIMPKILTEVHLPSLAGRTIIAERYLVDSAVSIAYALDDDEFHSRPAAKLLLRLIPKGSILIHLDSDYEAVRRRRRNLADPEGFHQFQRRAYRRLSAWLGATTIDTCARSVEETAGEIRRLVLAHLPTKARGAPPLASAPSGHGLGPTRVGIAPSRRS
jgi:thymidylate kinase